MDAIHLEAGRRRQQEEDNASVPVTLRYDPEPPQLAFEPQQAADPTHVAVRVADQVSGVADGVIEIGAAGSGVWHTLATQKDGDRLISRIDDAVLPAGTYLLRARAEIWRATKPRRTAEKTASRW